MRPTSPRPHNSRPRKPQPSSDLRGPAEYKRGLSEGIDPARAGRALRASWQIEIRNGTRTDMAKKQLVQIKVNGRDREATVEPRMLLVHFIRRIPGLTGTHVGCDTTHCGACTVLLDGKTVKSCTMFAVQADGCELLTVEGLMQNGKLHPLQQGFKEEHGLQCGFCTPGMLISSYALLEKIRIPAKRRSAGESPEICAVVRAIRTSSRPYSTLPPGRWRGRQR